ncbi:HET-domain-containing protein [Hyaloscypha variabilis F]|uniref:HET-domain-containing protein n=1 Tax=Hyaloscypha variabilis (strain UAMH 11265 / GT02V1 / F) TaxID=1149755 RepID=A0A2J6RP66_HYAVF|nr:HET-domain-containing protein [Hyaloscypha variabilis F]
MASRPTATHQSWDPPPQGFVQCYQDADDGVIETLKESSTYCPSCYTITRDLSVFAEPPDAIGSKAAVVFWDFHLKDLVDTAEGGCHFCGFIASRLLDDRNLTFFYSNSSNTQRVTKCCHLAARTEVHKNVLRSVANLREFMEGEPDASFTVAVEPVVDYLIEERKVGKVRFTLARSTLDGEVVAKFLGYRTEIVVELYTLKDTRVAKHLRYRPVNIDPSSDACINQAKSWIQNCIENHPNCPGLPDSQLPTRVLKIIDDNTLQLYAGNEKAQYATLSYCWGGPQTFSTTLSTLTQYTTGFSTSALPQTLQDAVQVTKRLGLKYIWIDSLCIIQDSPADKSHEIPRMALYYKNAYITICASRDTCNETFLNTTDACSVHPLTGIATDLLTIPYVLPSGGVESIFFREESPYWLSWEPISKRAWTLQERILSPRVLMFGSRTIWQCNSAQHSDGGNEDWTKDTRGSAHQRLQLDFTHSSSSPSSPDTTALYDLWHRTIHTYSTRTLTYPTDKLPAIAGLAIEFANLSGDTYLAGQWLSQLPRELLWSTYPSLHLLKPPSYRAPSWSWASVDNDVTFSRLPPSDAICLATVISCSVEPEDSESPFAGVKGGRLEIEALVLSLDKELVERFMRGQYMVPAPKGKDYDWHRVLLNMMRRGGKDGEEEKGEWCMPEGTVLLVLYAVLESKKERVSEEGSEKLGGGEVDEDETGEKVEDVVKSEEREPGNNLASLFGLLIAPVGDGNYERIAAFTDLRAAGEWDAPSNRSRVTIV